MERCFLMRLARFLSLAALVLFSSAARAADGAQPGDVVIVEAAGLRLGGELLSQDAEFLRLRLESGEVAVPASMVRSLTVVSVAAPLPAAPATPSPPPAPTPPRPPQITLPRGVWLSRWSSQLFVTAIGGGGGAHHTPIAARGPAASGGAGLGFESALPWISAGAEASFEQMRATLVTRGGSGCPSNVPDGCFAFPDGLAHVTQVARAAVFAKPYLLLGQWRPWLRLGGEIASVRYAYTGGATRFGAGAASGVGLVYGGGLDFATKSRGMIFTVGIAAGGAHGRETIGSLFGAPWKTNDAGPVTTATRVSLGVAIPVGGRP